METVETHSVRGVHSTHSLRFATHSLSCVLRLRFALSLRLPYDRSFACVMAAQRKHISPSMGDAEDRQRAATRQGPHTIFEYFWFVCYSRSRFGESCRFICRRRRLPFLLWQNRKYTRFISIGIPRLAMAKNQETLCQSNRECRVQGELQKMCVFFMIFYKRLNSRFYMYILLERRRASGRCGTQAPNNINSNAKEGERTDKNRLMSTLHPFVR